MFTSFRLPRHLRRVMLVFGLLLASLPLATPTLAVELIVDNSDGAVLIKGKWTATKETAGFLGADYLFRTPGDGNSSVSWPFPAGSPGRYEVFARWTSGPNRATNATYLINSNAGQANVGVTQKNNGGAWQSLGSFDFQQGKNQGITLTDKADGVVVADAIRFVGPQNASAPAAVQAQAQTAAPP